MMELEIEITSCFFGTCIFTANCLLVFFYGRHVRGEKGDKDKRSFITQMIFVSVNDMLCGFVLFLIGITRVTDNITAYMCVCFVYTGMILQTVSQGNITCICAQRYLSAKNIRKLSTKRQALYTKVLVAVNIIIGSMSLVSFILTSEIKDASEVTTRLCSISSLVRREVAYTSAAFFVMGLVLTIVADILCLMTVLKLKSEVNVAVQPSGSTADSAKEASKDTSTVRGSIKRTHQKAVVTLCLLLIFFNLAIVPSIVSYGMAFAGGYLSLETRRFFLISFFINSLFNPIIIGFRIDEIRAYIRDGFRNLTKKIQCCK